MDLNNLTAGRFQDVEWVSQTGSTNADLLEQAKVEPGLPRVLIADEQTAGRGRLDRSWDMTPGGGLMISFYVPWPTSATAQLLPTALGVAISAVIEQSGRSTALKWPNDIVVGSAVVGSAAVSSAGVDLEGKKLGGMLSSSVVVDGKFAGVVAGLGCNVSWPPLGFSELPDAAALDHLDGEPLDVRSLAAGLISRFDEELERIVDSGPEQLFDRYRNRCITLGQDVRVESAGSVIEGRATDIDPSGALLVEVDHQQIRVDVGDVTRLRPQGKQSEPRND